MKKALCPQCGFEVKRRDLVCPRCGGELDVLYLSRASQFIESLGEGKRTERRLAWGYEYRSEAEILGWPVIHVAFGKDAETGKIIVAKGIIAIGQFGVGLITIAQVGVGLLFGFGQCVAGIIAVGQFALGVCFGLGQFATGLTAIGQLALGRYVLTQIGIGQHVWSPTRKDPEAVEHFANLWRVVKGLMGWG
ncbi:MAG: hypothetical protein JW984_16510 [Deltaproteobacteria bacterium]|uniref:Zinc ribbon domain-containing protein n=1 Tax=Candidatus Zymogenus saltonus TaxID=2844893 RepID=A0A9D8KJP5_9DELT|nr:hypothetical protein [Candidatus Zymogenus saltonus]